MWYDYTAVQKHKLQLVSKSTNADIKQQTQMSPSFLVKPPKSENISKDITTVSDSYNQMQKTVLIHNRLSRPETE